MHALMTSGESNSHSMEELHQACLAKIEEHGTDTRWGNRRVHVRDVYKLKRRRAGSVEVIGYFDELDSDLIGLGRGAITATLTTDFHGGRPNEPGFVEVSWARGPVGKVTEIQPKYYDTVAELLIERLETNPVEAEE